MTSSIGDVLKDAQDALSHIDESRRDAEVLLAHILDRDKSYLRAFPEQALNESQIKRFTAAVSRRAKHEPVSRIIGRRSFWSLEFEVTPDTLDPRPDTETLVECALKSYPGGVSNFLDLGTGTGCIAIALLKEWPRAKACATDISEAALCVAQRNADRHGVSDRLTLVANDWTTCDWTISDSTAGLAGTYDLILSNPPYIDRSFDLPPEVLNFDPHAALFADQNGTAAYEILWPQSYTLLRPGGHAMMEIGWDQSQSVQAIAKRVGFDPVECVPDLAGQDRVVVGQKPL